VDKHYNTVHTVLDVNISALLNIIPSIFLISIFILFTISTLHKRKITDVVVIRTKSWVYLVGTVSIILCSVIALEAWHALDLIGKSLCHFQNNSSLCISNCTQLDYRQNLHRATEGIVSWRPTIYVVSVLLGFSAFQIFVHVHMYNVQCVILCTFVILLNVVAYFQHNMCNSYFTDSCVFACDDAVSALCRVPLFDLSLWYSSVAFLVLLLVKRRSQHIRFVRARPMPTTDKWIDVQM